MRRPPLVSLAVLVLCSIPLVLTGCSNNSTNADQNAKVSGNTPPVTAVDTAGFLKTTLKGKHGGTFSESSIADPKTFNLLFAKEQSSVIPLGLIFDGMVIRDADTLEIKPALAERWESSNKDLTWTFHLRRGLKWSDGQPVTADDVVFTLDVIYDPKVDTTTREVLKVDGKPWKYKKVDDLTVEIDLPVPFGPFLDTVGFPILPKHKLEQPWKAGQFNSTWGVNTPPTEIVGTGPYTLLKFTPGESMVFKRNPNYWQLDADGKQLPFLDGGTIAVVPDLNATLLKFKSKETDYTAVRPEDWETIKSGEAAGDYKAADYGPTWGISYLSFNMNPNASKLAPYKLAWFSKKEFRQAISYALDRDAMAKTVLRGFGEPLWSPIPVANKTFHNPNVMKYPRDLSKAKALLATAGFKLQPGNEVLQDSAGHPVEFTLLTNTGNNINAAYCNIIVEDLKQIGVKVNFTPVEFNSLVTRLSNTYDWEAVVLGFTGGTEPHNSKSIWTSPGQLHLWNPRQKTPATPWEAEIDKLFSEAAKITDTAERKKRYDRFQEIAAEQQPLIFLVSGKALFAIRNRLTNLRPSSLGGIRWNIQEIAEK